jgi:hypothetical protein
MSRCHRPTARRRCSTLTDTIFRQRRPSTDACAGRRKPVPPEMARVSTRPGPRARRFPPKPDGFGSRRQGGEVLLNCCFQRVYAGALWKAPSGPHGTDEAGRSTSPRPNAALADRRRSRSWICPALGADALKRTVTARLSALALLPRPGSAHHGADVGLGRGGGDGENRRLE